MAANAQAVACICCTFLSWSWTAEQSPPLCGLPQATTDPLAKIAANALFVAWSCCTFLSWSTTAEQSPPLYELPQVSTDPSAKIAASAPSVAWSCCTFLSWSRTAEQSPPWCSLPQAATDPSARIAANAPFVVDWTCCTFLSCSFLCAPNSKPPQATIWFPPQHKANAPGFAATIAPCATAVRCSPSFTAACKGSSGSVRTRPSTVTNFRKPLLKVFLTRSFKSPTLECSGSSRVSPEPLGNDTLMWSMNEDDSDTDSLHSEDNTIYPMVIY